jgi:hypothetical protein
MTAGFIGALGMLSNAQAVNLNKDGLGQVLIYPYYNVNNGFQTMFSLTNTTNYFTAVKIRFRSSGNSNDLLDFNVYMSPKDVWSATIRNVNDVANIITIDETCTLPGKAALQDGENLRDVYDSTDPEDVREGYIEVIEMGVLGYDSDLDGIPDTPVTEVTLANGIDYAAEYIASNILHDSTGMPTDCGVIHDAWVDAGEFAVTGTYPNGGFTEGGAFVIPTALTAGTPDLPKTTGTAGLTDYPANLVTPQGGLTGNTILLNVNTGSAYVADSTIIDGYATAYHINVPTIIADDSTANDVQPFIDANGNGVLDLGEQVGLAIHYENQSGADIPVGVYPVTGAQHYRADDRTDYMLPSLASGSSLVSNQTWGDSSAAHQMIWGPSVAADDATGPDAGLLLDVVDYGLFDINVAPNTQVPSGVNPYPMAHVMAVTSLANAYFVDPAFDGATDWVITLPMKKHGIFNVSNRASASGIQDVQVAISSWDREEGVTAAPDVGDDFSPPLQEPIVTKSLTREVNILTAGTGTLPTNNVLGSVDGQLLDVDFIYGWAQVVFNDRYDLLSVQVGSSSTVDPIGTDIVDDFWTYSEQATSELVTARVSDLAATAVVNVTDGSLPGVPAIGFAATRGNLGADAPEAQVGETIPHVITGRNAPTPAP